jgi:hypothetical protein
MKHHINKYWDLWLLLALAVLLTNLVHAEEEPIVDLIPQDSMGFRGHVQVKELEWKCESPWLGKAAQVCKVAEKKESYKKLVGLAEHLRMERRPDLIRSTGKVVFYEGKNSQGGLIINPKTREIDFIVKSDKISLDENMDPIIKGIPETPQLIATCLEWMNKIGMDRNNFLKNPDSVGGFEFRMEGSTVEYLNHKQQKRLTYQATRNISFTWMIGDFPAFWNGFGGRAIFTFRDGGEMSRIEFCLRESEPMCKCQVLSQKEVTQAILEGFCWVDEPLKAEKGIITRIRLEAYHARDSELQNHFPLVWLVDIEPVGKPDDAVRLAIPALKQHRDSYGKTPIVSIPLAKDKGSDSPGIVPMEEN